MTTTAIGLVLTWARTSSVMKILRTAIEEEIPTPSSRFDRGGSAAIGCGSSRGPSETRPLLRSSSWVMMLALRVIRSSHNIVSTRRCLTGEPASSSYGKLRLDCYWRRPGRLRRRDPRGTTWQKGCLRGQERYGGTCNNWGCIPTKALLKNAELYHDMKDRAAEFGFAFDGLNFDWSKVIKRSRDVS